MMAITHASIAAAGTSLIIGTADPMALGLAVLGSQLPDIDTTTSTIGKIFFPISSFFEDRFPHRSITYSPPATALDFTEEVKLPILPDQYRTVSLAGAVAQMEYYGLESAIAILREQCTVGKVMAKIVSPRPKF
jgi:hypothetical protein